ncbi:MAG: DUF4153 domain-containing protein [Rikenellaceae bacterium]|nr:DUF4153 domain-containing protein [Rikenellaceae bacterium]
MKINITKIRTRIKDVFFRSPVEILVALFYFLLWILEPDAVSASANAMILYPVVLALIYSVNKLTYGTKFRFMYYLSVLSVIPPFFLWWPEERVLVLYISAVLLLFISHRTDNNRSFVERNFLMIGNLMVSGALVALFAVIFHSIINFTAYIFNLEYRSWEIVEFLSKISSVLLWPVMFLIFDRDDRRVKAGRSIKVLIDYILSPAVLIYAVLLYVYFAKILFAWELPQGTVSSVSLIFLFAGIVIYSLQYLLEKKYYRWLYDYLPLWVLPAVIMAWIAVIYRINEYGFTTARVYLLYTTSIATVFYIAFIVKRNTYRLRWLCLFALAVLLSTFIPGITPHNIEQRSQKYIENDIFDDFDYTPVYFEEDNNSVYLSSYNSNMEIDIRGYSRFYEVDKYYDRRDDNSLRCENRDDVLLIIKGESDTLYSIGYEELTSRIFGNAGISRYVSETPESLIRDNKEKFLEYTDDPVKLIFLDVGYLGKCGDNEKYLIDHPIVKYFLTK